MRASTCLECGASFTFPARRGPSPLTCGDPCKAARAERYQRQTFNRTCVECGQPFSTHNRRTRCCGTACGHARGKRLGDATRMRLTALRRARTCEHCGKPFTAHSPSGKARAGKVREGRFCGVACRVAARRRGELKAEGGRGVESPQP